MRGDTPLTPAQQDYMFVHPHASLDDLLKTEVVHQRWWFRRAQEPLMNAGRLRLYRERRDEYLSILNPVLWALGDTTPAIERRRT